MKFLIFRLFIDCHFFYQWARWIIGNPTLKLCFRAYLFFYMFIFTDAHSRVISGLDITTGVSQQCPVSKWIISSSYWLYLTPLWQCRRDHTGKWFKRLQREVMGPVHAVKSLEPRSRPKHGDRYAVFAWRRASAAAGERRLNASRVGHSNWQVGLSNIDKSDAVLSDWAVCNLFLFNYFWVC